MGSLQLNQKPWIEKVQYLRLDRAAELLDWPSDVLLHLGAIGEVEMLAPVLSAGQYEWEVSKTGGRLRWGEEPVFSASFDYRDRVILFAKDVAKIETVGWVIPEAFFSPSVARELAERLQDAGSRSISPGLQDGPNESTTKWAEFVPWARVDPRSPIEILRSDDEFKVDAPDARVTAQHLWLSREELERLTVGHPQGQSAKMRTQISQEAEHSPPRRNVENAQRFSNNREEVLMAAIACLFSEKAKELKISGTRWAEIIDEKAQLFWERGCAPLTRQEMTKLLNKTKKFPEKASWKGREG